MPLPEFNALILDLEVVPEKEEQAARIIKVGAMRSDRSTTLEMNTPNARELQSALERLDALAQDARCVVGHNILAHDLPLLRAAAPSLRLLHLPVIDTLRLSPLAFPQNPYHRLVKDYKIISGSLNSPLADCRATLTLLQDQHGAFTRLAAQRPAELVCYQALIAQQPGAGLGDWMQGITGQAPVSVQMLGNALSALVRETDPVLERDLKVCSTRLQSLISTDLGQDALHWPIAYALAWLRVSGGNSVLAPWVRYQFPLVGQLITELRDTPCGSPVCQYCRTTHDPQRELQRYFGFADFRIEPDGRTLQRDTVLAGMQGKHVLAVLATGGGKSLCYQLPALNRYHRNGSLTIVISPLQSLMKDQVDGLLGKNVQCVATLNGMLTMPERADVLEKIQMGDIGILLVSPEQLRNKAFGNAIKNRQIGAWIFDEAHCLSKWGNDFRPDYLYASRFIRQQAANNPLPAIGCFTATAKLDVLADIRAHFKESLGIFFQELLGTHERTNLDFDVLPCNTGEKWGQVHALLQSELTGNSGGAVVFVASRKNAEELAEFLRKQEMDCAHFHAGLEPQSKRDVQDAFIRGATRIIVATNAFGMGVDKPDIRLVVHAEIPGSLENYLQEAGRAGRDQGAARCVLLYDPQDIEMQFGLSERAKLGQRDIQNILGKLRRESDRRRGAPLVITAGEILLDDAVETSFDASDRDAETKVATAIAWLERGQFLSREENSTKIFPGRPKLPTLEDACRQLDTKNLPQRRREEFRAVLAYLYAAPVDERISTDQLMQLTRQTAEEVAAMLKQLADLELLVNDTQITVYLRHGVADASMVRLKDCLQLEQAMFRILREQAPDADHGEWQHLSLPFITTALREQSIHDVLPLHVLRLLRSLAQDSDGDSQHRGSLEVRQLHRDALRLKIRDRRTWSDVEKMGEKRRALAQCVLVYLLGKIAPQVRGKDLLVEATFGELTDTIKNDVELHSLISATQRHRAVEHTLLYLHQQEILTLNHGMTVMRRAMTLKVNADKKARYQKDDYQLLDAHYRERRIQVHVMREYAEIALREVAQALKFVMHYFTKPGNAFQRDYFAGRADVLKLATSEASWRSIVGGLNATQKEVVMDDGDGNRLILAGPGSGKTRVVVHRIAYLVRVQRVPPGSIIAMTFNRHAANEIRERLHALVGADAYGVTVLTYHAMAMRLTGTSFQRRDSVSEADLTDVLHKAVALLESGQQATAVTDGREDEDGLRARLLRGYRYIVVDEYQDIDELQYRLVSALAGRNAGEEGRLCLLAVEDDDQNIYAFRNTSNRYIELFRQDYAAQVSYLVENYRSTQHIIASANQLIAGNAAKRLKAEHPIRVDAERADAPLGGRWSSLDAVRAGQVLCLRIPHAPRHAANLQAQAVVAELQRLLALEGRTDWDDCAVLAKEWSYLEPIQAWCELHGVPYSLVRGEAGVPFICTRAFVYAMDALRASTVADMTLAEMAQVIAASCDGGAVADDHFFSTALRQLQMEFGEARLGRAMVLEFLYDAARELRRQPQQGLFLGTVHAAKGLEFRHVALLDGGWSQHRQAQDDERRLFYVGMTRARETLTLTTLGVEHPFVQDLPPAILSHDFRGHPVPELNRRYHDCSLGDMNMDFAGRQDPHALVHQALKNLRPGDPLKWHMDNSGSYEFKDRYGETVGRSAQAFRLSWMPERIEVSDVVVRKTEQVTDEKYRNRLLCAQWELLIPRFVGTQGV